MKRPAARTTGMLAVSILIAVFTGAPAAVAAPDDINITFCHANSDVKDAYVVGLETDSSSILKTNGQGVQIGHSGHTGPVFTPGMTKGWGDIIPAFDYPGGHYDGLNVGSGGDGQAWLDRSCKPPPELTLVKVVEGSNEPASSWTLHAAGTSISGATGTAGATGEVLAGTYALSESGGPTGYTPSGWFCSNATGSGQSVTIGKAEVDPVTCTITNTLAPPTEVTVATLTLTPGTCDVAGSVDATPTGDYTWGFTGSDNARYYTATHIGNVVLVGNAPQGPFDVSKIPSQSTNPQGACYVSPTLLTSVSVTPPTFTAGTCHAVGSVVAADTAAYSWGTTGPATARTYTAVAKTGYTLTGTASFGPDDLSRIASQSTNPNGVCYVAPPVVSPVVLGVVKNAPAVRTIAPKTLAFTGAEPVPLSLLALLALVLGVALTVVGRRQGSQGARG